MKIIKIALVLLIALLFFNFKDKDHPKPVIYLVGDSTVKNGKGDGAGGLWGWGDFIGQFLDTTKISVQNHALGGTSSRTFQSKGLWEPVYNKLKKGDYVIIQFGHNDDGPLNDTLRARGTIKGIGEETQEKIKGSEILILNALRHEEHVSHFTLEQAMEMANKLQIPQVYFTHISHQLGMHEKISAILPPHMHLAYDGLKLQFS